MAGGAEAIYGLVGVVVGGGITVTGTIWAQRLQVKAAVAAERRSREITASANLIDAISQLLHLPGEPDQGGPDHAGWARQRRHLLLIIDTATQDLRDRRFRDRLGEAHRMLALHEGAWALIGQPEATTRAIACADALACLGAFRRGDPPPPPPANVTATTTAVNDWLAARTDPDG
nr:hypothetical protein [Micromonospora sp. DSM 115978]